MRQHWRLGFSLDTGGVRFQSMGWGLNKYPSSRPAKAELQHNGE